MYWPTFAVLGISIHAPLRERHDTSKASDRFGAISIHAPLRERRLMDHF